MPTISARLPAPPLKTEDRGLRRTGTLLLTAGLGGILAWSAVAPIESAAVAPGVVAVESARKSIAHLRGGIVAEILVREGDRVRAGQLLLRLDDTEARSEYQAVQARIAALGARKARLSAEKSGAETLARPENLQERAALRSALEREAELMTSRKAALDGEQAVLEQQQAQLEAQVAGLAAQIEAAEERLGLYGEEIEALESLERDGIGDRSRLMEWRRRAADLRGEIAGYRAAQAEARVRIGEIGLQIEQLHTARGAQIAEGLAEVEAELADLTERERALARALDLTELSAPVEGTVMGLQASTIGGVVRPGEPVLDLVPAGDELIVEARVSPQDIDRVQAGQTAELRMTALPGRTTPTVEGTLETVSADALLDERTGEAYYRARISVQENSWLSDLQPGMPVLAFVQTGSQSFASYLIRPMTDSLAWAFREQ